LIECTTLCPVRLAKKEPAVIRDRQAEIVLVSDAARHTPHAIQLSQGWSADNNSNMRDKDHGVQATNDERSWGTVAASSAVMWQSRKVDISELKDLATAWLRFGTPEFIPLELLPDDPSVETLLHGLHNAADQSDTLYQSA
jgi:hypothetical protein